MQDLSEVNEDALKIEENNALALAIFEPGESCMLTISYILYIMLLDILASNLNWMIVVL